MTTADRAPVSFPEDNDTKERLSLAYVRAVAARCGCYVTANEGGDLASIDATLHSARQPKRMISFQLKATAGEPPAGDIPFDLPIKNYEDLREPTPTAPQALVVLYIPEDPSLWTSGDETRLVLQRAAWWVDLWGMPASENTATVRVWLPRARLFNPEGLMRMLAAAEMIAKGGERKPLHELV